MSTDHPLSSQLPSDLLADLLSAAKPKARSMETHDSAHIPDLNSLPGPISCLLLGDSMFERFKTTGRYTPFGPDSNAVRNLTSSIALPVTHADDGAEIAAGAMPNDGPQVSSSASDFIDPSLIPSYNPTTGVFNVGVGGDSLKNIIYRLTGTPANPGGLLDALSSLPDSHQPQYIFLLVGTNDLGDGRKALPASSLSQYRLVIDALTHIFPGAKICVCGLMPKAKVKKASVIDESNVLLQALVIQVSKANAQDRPEDAFLPADQRLDIQHLESDGVHLHSEGYEILGTSMLAKLEALKSDDTLRKHWPAILESRKGSLS